MLSMFVGNGAQLCSMTGVTLGLFYHRFFGVVTLTSDSVRVVWISVSVEPGFHRHRYDDLLDVLRGVNALIVRENKHSLTCWDCRVSGYIASRVYASLGGTEKRKLAFFTATILPT